ncbi:putative RNA-directed DNA polymerase [Tanacetum coccineum]
MWVMMMKFHSGALLAPLIEVISTSGTVNWMLWGLNNFSKKNGDDYIEDTDPITLISKLDISDPLHLHPNDTTALIVVSIKLEGTENYQVWSCFVLLALEGKNKTGFINGTCKRSNTNEVLGRQWDGVNAIVLELKETYDKVDGSIMFGLHHQINTLKQNGSSIADYYHKLNALWKQFDAMIELPKCVCNASEGFKKHTQLMKLMQFLMGLDDSYMQMRSYTLSIEVLPDVRSAYATISSEESHRVVVGSIAGFSQRNQASDFVSNNLGFNDHTIDRCFKIIRYPADFRKKKFGQNSKGKNISNNVVGSGSSTGFTDEQMATLISLIKDNKNGKNVQANMAANQHMTYIDKELDNVLDISHLKIKLAKENKIIVAFDESRCYFLNKDLNLGNILGTGNQCEGLYYYNDQGIKSNLSVPDYQCYLSQHDRHCRFGHPAEPVLNVLKGSLQIDNMDKNVYCETCQRAKQTIKPFSLSDHVSKSLGDLVHLDLWGPYQVTSSEGFRYFLTVMDDFTRAVWVYLIKSKDEVPHLITIFYNLIENQFKRKIKVFKSDNRTEFVNQIVNSFCAKKGIIHQNSGAYTPQQMDA